MAGRRTRVLALATLFTVMLVACGPRFPGRADNVAAGQPTAGATTLPTDVAAPTTGPTTVATRAPRATQGPPRTISVRGGGIPKGGVIKVGGLFPLTGGLSALGVPASRGAEAYFNWIN